MKNKSWIVIVPFLLVATSVVAKPDGNDLLKACLASINETDIVGATYCTGFIKGILTLNEAYEYVLKQEGSNPFFCSPNMWTE